MKRLSIVICSDLQRDFERNGNYVFTHVIRTVILLLGFLIFFNSCNKDENIILTIASKRPTPTTAINPPCYIVKHEGHKEWGLLYEGIAGFDYLEGYEYVLNVKVIKVSDSPMDGGTNDYKLNYIISFDKKESEGLPSWAFKKDAIN